MRFLISCLIIFLSINACVCELFSNQSADTTKSIMIAKIDISPSIKDLSPRKIEAGLLLATLITNKYKLIPNSLRDSVSKNIIKDGNSITIYDLAKELKAQQILFIRINKIENILRADITIIDNSFKDTISDGKGYSFINIHNEETDAKIYDNALLNAIQRAFAVAQKDSMMYRNKQGELRVIPAETIVIGGLDYQHDQNLTTWSLFNHKLMSSYDAIETIFEIFKDIPNYIAYDPATRDSMYAMVGLYEINNYLPVSYREIEAMTAFEVDKFLSGTFKRIEEGVLVELSLYKVEKNMLKFIDSKKDILKSDNIDAMRDILRILTWELMVNN